jgi:hypothetical protein
MKFNDATKSCEMCPKGTTATADKMSCMKPDMQCGANEIMGD